MPLALVTGPANSAKARVVLERFRAQIARGPILVVPTAADAVHYRRELAETGVVLGARVESFGGLMREIAVRSGLPGRPLSEAARERVVAAAVAEAPLELLRPSAAAPGFLTATTRLMADLGARRVEPPRLTAALRRWAPSGRRAAYCEEVAAIYAGYRRRLARVGRLDAEQFQVRALDAVRLDPTRWGRTPVLLYGFDDLDPLQLDAVETLAREADVVLSLPYEPGRVALAGRAATFETLRPAAAEVIVLPARAEHYEAPSRASLHHLERALFEEEGPRTDGGEAVVLLEGETERSELELVGEEVRALLSDGYGPEDVAVVMRSVTRSQALVAEVFAEQGIPVSIVRSIRFADTAVGRGLLGLLRSALADGGVEDLLDWLRAPGLFDHPELVDRFEARLRRSGVRGATSARAAWEHFPLEGLDRLRTAADRGPGALLARTARELERLLAAPHRRAAHVLGGDELAEARVIAGAAGRLAELGELTAADRSLGPTPAELIATLAALELQPPPPPGGVLVCDALSLRARRVRALFVCGLQEGAFPAVAREAPFFSADERAEIARSSGLVLAAFEDSLAAERYLFYATTSRAESRLRLSWHTSADDGSPIAESMFLEDVRDAFSTVVARGRREGDGDAAERVSAAIGGAAGSGGAPLGRLCSAGVLAALAGRTVQSPSALETWTACPVAWFVEGLLKVRPLEPADETPSRGTVAHAVLARVAAELCAAGEWGSADGEAVRSMVAAALEEQAGAVSASPERDRAARRRLAADLGRYLSGVEGGDHTPQEFELSFGLPGAEHPAVTLADGALTVRGRIDRVDVDTGAGTAIVHDYKSGEVLGAAKWEERGKLALALYMLAAAELLGVEVAGGLYQPVRGSDLRPRGALRADAEPALACVGTDRIGGAELEAVVAGALERAVRAAEELRAGALAPRPATCTRSGVCRHPAICRSGPGAPARAAGP
ncbi:MAG: PD-(D/E)XK nuclease family protein [Solirubrobacteraceae bacterium]